MMDFLEEFKRKNSTLGVDPARNISKKQIKRNKLYQFFLMKNSNIILRKYSKPNIVVCRNVVPHVENIKSLMKGISNILDENGKVYIEFHFRKFIKKITL